MNAEYYIERLEEALELQQNTEGKIVSTPTVTYCFKCDEIEVDSWLKGDCLDHPVVSSDGYEHAGIQDALVALQQVNDD